MTVFEEEILQEDQYGERLNKSLSKMYDEGFRLGNADSCNVSSI